MMLLDLIKVRRRECYSANKIDSLHNKLLPQVIRDAYEHVPYYRELYRDLSKEVIYSIQTAEDLKKLPIAKRDHLKEKPLKYRMDERFNDKMVTKDSTSGSTGIPLDICNSNKDLSYLRMIFMNDLIQSGLRPWDRVAYLKVFPFKEHFFSKFGIMPFYRIATNQPIDNQIEEFLKFQPTFLTGFFNTAYLIVREMKRRKIKYTKLKALLLGGERVKQSTKREIEDFFDAKVVEIYSSTDTMTIARECPLGNKHVHSGDLIVEVLKEDGTTSLDEGKGEILVTRLVSKAMPLIRYELGDIIELKPNDCTCGIYHTPIIKEVYGRTNDYIIDEDDCTISYAVLVCIADKFQEIKQIQFFQKNKKEIEILYILQEGQEDIDKLVIEKFEKALPQFCFTVRRVNELVKTKNGKVKVVNSVIGFSP